MYKEGFRPLLKHFESSNQQNKRKKKNPIIVKPKNY